MTERLNYLVPQILPHETERTDKNGNPVGLYCKIDTKELVLPKAITKEKYDYIYDAYFDGAFDLLTPTKRHILLTYYSTGHNFETLGKILGMTRASVNFHVKTGNEIVWQNTSEETKQRFTHQVAMQCKDKYEQRRGNPGRPISDSEKDRLRKIATDNMTDEQKERLRALGKAYMTQEEKDKRRSISLAYWAERKKTEPQKISKPKISKPSNYIPRIKKPVVEKPKSEPIVLAASELAPIEHKPITKPVVEPPPTPPAKVKNPEPEPKPKTKLDVIKETVAYVLSDKFPPEIREYFKDHPGTKHEWKSFMSSLNPTWPYISYQKGKLWYERDPRDKEDKGFKYELTNDILDAIWDGTGWFYKDQHNINNFAILNPLRIESLLRRMMIN